jgi:fumarylacetoacetase
MSPNDPDLKSFIEVAPDHDFPIQNLPYGVFSTAAALAPRVGVAIGDYILDLAALHARGLLPEVGATNVFAAGAINGFMALGPATWKATRARISQLLQAETPTLRDDAALRATALVGRADARMHLPLHVTAFSDFFSSKQHATNAGKIIRGEASALAPNWLTMPIGYNSRASTVVVSGTPVRRPLGQRKPRNAEHPSFGPCANLDCELEMGVVIGTGSPMGEMIDEATAEKMIFGFTLLNDWSARDIQAWEYQPLGPFLAKAFATTISPWIVTAEALEPFRVEGPAQDPAPFPYLRQGPRRNYNVTLDLLLKTSTMTAHTPISQTNFSFMYWSSVQQLMHHACTGCAMSVGDLLGSGTISGDARDQLGSLLELSWGGSNPIELPNGEKRTFLQDGDSLMIRGYARGKGYRISFGEAEGVITPALPPPV